MPSTLDNILTAIRAADIVPDGSVNYGFVNNIGVPRVAVSDYSHVLDYDTSGPVLKTATFTVTVYSQSQTTAESLAELVDAVLNNNLTLTALTIGCLQTGYRVGQFQGEPLDQYAAQMTYQLTENLS